MRSLLRCLLWLTEAWKHLCVCDSRGCKFLLIRRGAANFGAMRTCLYLATVCFLSCCAWFKEENCGTLLFLPWELSTCFLISYIPHPPHPPPMVSGFEWHCEAEVIRRDFTLASRKGQRFLWSYHKMAMNWLEKRSLLPWIGGLSMKSLVSQKAARRTEPVAVPPGAFG